MIGQPDDLASLTPPPPPIKRVMVNWKPDVCITDSADSGISQTLTATTEVTASLFGLVRQILPTLFINYL